MVFRSKKHPKSSPKAPIFCYFFWLFQVWIDEQKQIMIFRSPSLKKSPKTRFVLSKFIPKTMFALKIRIKLHLEFKLKASLAISRRFPGLSLHTALSDYMGCGGLAQRLQYINLIPGLARLPGSKTIKVGKVPTHLTPLPFGWRLNGTEKFWALWDKHEEVASLWRGPE